MAADITLLLQGMRKKSAAAAPPPPPGGSSMETLANAAQIAAPAGMRMPKPLQPAEPPPEEGDNGMAAIQEVQKKDKEILDLHKEINSLKIEQEKANAKSEVDAYRQTELDKIQKMRNGVAQEKSKLNELASQRKADTRVADAELKAKNQIAAVEHDSELTLHKARMMEENASGRIDAANTKAEAANAQERATSSMLKLQLDSEKSKATLGISPALQEQFNRAMGSIERLRSLGRQSVKLASTAQGPPVLNGNNQPQQPARQIKTETYRYEGPGLTTSPEVGRPPTSLPGGIYRYDDVDPEKVKKESEAMTRAATPAPHLSPQPQPDQPQQQQSSSTPIQGQIPQTQSPETSSKQPEPEIDWAADAAQAAKDHAAYRGQIDLNKRVQEHSSDVSGLLNTGSTYDLRRAQAVMEGKLNRAKARGSKSDIATAQEAFNRVQSEADFRETITGNKAIGGTTYDSADAYMDLHTANELTSKGKHGDAMRYDPKTGLYGVSDSNYYSDYDKLVDQVSGDNTRNYYENQGYFGNMWDNFTSGDPRRMLRAVNPLNLANYGLASAAATLGNNKEQIQQHHTAKFKEGLGLVKLKDSGKPFSGSILGRLGGDSARINGEEVSDEDYAKRYGFSKAYMTNRANQHMRDTGMNTNGGGSRLLSTVGDVADVGLTAATIASLGSLSGVTAGVQGARLAALQGAKSMGANVSKQTMANALRGYRTAAVAAGRSGTAKGALGKLTGAGNMYNWGSPMVGLGVPGMVGDIALQLPGKFVGNVMGKAFGQGGRTLAQNVYKPVSHLYGGGARVAGMLDRENSLGGLAHQFLFDPKNHYTGSAAEQLYGQGGMQNSIAQGQLAGGHTPWLNKMGAEKLEDIREYADPRHDKLNPRDVAHALDGYLATPNKNTSQSLMLNNWDSNSGMEPADFGGHVGGAMGMYSRYGSLLSFLGLKDVGQGFTQQKSQLNLDPAKFQHAVMTGNAARVKQNKMDYEDQRILAGRYERTNPITRTPY